MRQKQRKACLSGLCRVKHLVGIGGIHVHGALGHCLRNLRHFCGLKAMLSFTQRNTRDVSLTVTCLICDQSKKMYPTHWMKSSLMRRLRLINMVCNFLYNLAVMHSAMSAWICSAPLPIYQRRLYAGVLFVFFLMSCLTPSCAGSRCTLLCHHPRFPSHLARK